MTAVQLGRAPSEDDDEARAAETARLLPDLSRSLRYLFVHLRPALVGPWAGEFGQQVLERHRRLHRAAREQPQRQRLRTPCPACDALGLVREDGGIGIRRGPDQVQVECVAWTDQYFQQTIEQQRTSSNTLSMTTAEGAQDNTPVTAMTYWTEQIRGAVQLRLYLVGLLAALELPHLAASLQTPSGKGERRNYIDALQTVLKLPHDEAQRIYRFRCSLAHQGRLGHDDEPVPFAFAEPGAGAVLGGYGSRFTLYPSGRTYEMLDLDEFVEMLCVFADRWAVAHVEDPIVLTNLPRFITRHPEGMRPNIQGIPMIF